MPWMSSADVFKFSDVGDNDDEDDDDDGWMVITIVKKTFVP